MEEVILQRGSTRALQPDEVTSAQFDWVLEAGCVRCSAIGDPSATLLDTMVLAHAVKGRAPGLYSVGVDGPQLVREGDLRPGNLH